MLGMDFSDFDKYKAHKNSKEVSNHHFCVANADMQSF